MQALATAKVKLPDDLRLRETIEAYGKALRFCVDRAWGLEGIFKENSDPAKRREEWLDVKRGEKQVIKHRIESLRKSGEI